MDVAITPVYQPIVELGSRVIVGYEALVRTAPGIVRATPAELFEAAHRHGVATEFDWRCRMTALSGALDAGFPTDLMLSINAEPEAIDSPPPAEARDLIAAARGLSITVEITERNMLSDPAGLLRAVETARHMGWRIALDDVGADSSSLAMLEMLRPDVIKLDMRFVHGPATAETSAIAAAVARESARTGATVVAEGIETEEHAERAREVGASLGQGWLYGHPGELPTFPSPRPTAPAPTVRYPPAVTVRDPSAVTPRGLIRSLPSERVDSPTLDALESRLLTEAATLGPATLVLVCIPATMHLGAERAQLLSHVAEHTAMTVVFGSDDPTPPGCRGVDLGSDDPLARERSVIVVAPTRTAAIVALAQETTDGDTTYDHIVTDDHDLTLDAATLLVRRLPRDHDIVTDPPSALRRRPSRGRR